MGHLSPVVDLQIWASQDEFYSWFCTWSDWPVSYQDLYRPGFRWLWRSDSFWYHFCEMRIVISHLQVYEGEALCHYPILLYLMGLVACRDPTLSVPSRVLEVDFFCEDGSDNWNNSAILFQINVTFKTHGEIVLWVIEFVLFYFFISLTLTGQIRRQTFSNLIFFFCRALQNLSDQGTYVLGSQLILLLNLYKSFFKLWTDFMLLRYRMFSNCYYMEKNCDYTSLFKIV